MPLNLVAKTRISCTELDPRIFLRILIDYLPKAQVWIKMDKLIWDQMGDSLWISSAWVA